MGRRILVTVKPSSRSASLIHLAGNEFRAAVCEPPRHDAANRGVIELIAKHFGVPPSAIKIVRGHRSRKKLVDIG
jgi:uncharacterized protein YggU (UPF0235/DUF167 family)